MDIPEYVKRNKSLVDRLGDVNNKRTRYVDIYGGSKQNISDQRNRR